MTAGTAIKAAVASTRTVLVLHHARARELCEHKATPYVVNSALNFGFASFFHTAGKKQSLPDPFRDPGLAWTSVISHPLPVPGPKGIPSRSEQLAKLQQVQSTKDEEYDILIIGAGATGAGIALDAASRGLKVACVERGDFSSETSSRSTKLIWAGIRYLGTAGASLLSVKLLQNPSAAIKEFWSEMKMVWQCHVERRYMVTKQKHLCHWVPIVVPFTSWYITPPPMGHPLYSFFPILAPATFKFYDSMSFFTCPPSYILTKSRTKEVFPQLATDNLKYCSVFYEGQHNDARTNLAIAMTAAEKGAHIANYVEMTGLIREDHDNEKVVGANVLDRMTGRVWEIRAKKVVFAGGPFTDDLRRREVTTGKEGSFIPSVRGSSGIHIVLPGHVIPKDMGLLDYNTSDGRFLFILPWLNHTLIGTTDRMGPAETLHNPPEDEIEWLLNESQKYLRSDIVLHRSDVLSAWRGWRPLAADPHAPPGAPVSRDHVISENPNTGVIFVAGGKWTTWREMAQEVTDLVVAQVGGGQKCSTLEIGLHGADGYSEDLASQVMKKYGWKEAVAEHLVGTYGGRVWEVCENGSKNPEGFGKVLVDGYPYIGAEVVYACREYACTIEDVLSRRTRLAFLNKDAAMSAIPQVADIMTRELGWDKRVKQEQIIAAQNYVESYSGRIPPSGPASTESLRDAVAA
jgi:glycerol-3-phosphate dehydrogenase